jgi:hypothetical protein
MDNRTWIACRARLPAFTLRVGLPAKTLGPAKHRLRVFAVTGDGPGYRGTRLGPHPFSGRRSVGQLRSPPVERDDPQCEFERVSIERLGELRDSYEIVA